MANPNFVISGKVYDNLQQPLNNISCEFVNEVNNDRLTAVTNINGEYSINLSAMANAVSNNNKISCKFYDNESPRKYEPSNLSILVNLSKGSSTGNNIYMQGYYQHINTPRLWNHLKAISRQSFIRYLTDTSVLSTSFTTKTGAAARLVLKFNQIAYITDIFIGSNGSTDKVIMHLMRAATNNGGGTTTQIGPDFTSGEKGAMVHYNLGTPLRIAYQADLSQSIVMAVKGSGNTDNAIIGFGGYIINE